MSRPKFAPPYSLPQLTSKHPSIPACNNVTPDLSPLDSQVETTDVFSQSMLVGTTAEPTEGHSFYTGIRKDL